jgi:magnesium transporter
MSSLDPERAAVVAGTTATRTPPNTCMVIHDRGSEEIRFNRENVERLLAGDSFFWLDVDQPNEDDYAVLRDVFKFHPLAVEDSEKFGQRAKLDDYDDVVFIVVYGAVPDDDRLVEVHCFYSEKFLVTVHRDEAPAFTEVRDRYVMRTHAMDDPAQLLYRIIDALVDSFFPILADFDDRIDELENETFLRAGDEQLQEIFRMKRLLVGMRKAITPQRDMFASLIGGVSELPGMRQEDERYFRDIYDHLLRISDLIDTYRDLLTSSMDVYLSTVSNRLNTVMKQLTIMATVFLPLTFVTGFFGQNFGWMVGNIQGSAAFFGLGIGLEVLTVAALFLLFKKRGWF